MYKLQRVLHVDDDVDILEVSLIALAVVGGLEVTQCTSGHEALAKVRTARPDLFLLDVMMPEMDGVETLQGLRAIPRFSGTPAIFMTAKSEKAEIRRLMETGALDVIIKPFNAVTLASQIAAIWGRRPTT
jgi:CheY-like chemotaxis protein